MLANFSPSLIQIVLRHDQVQVWACRWITKQLFGTESCWVESDPVPHVAAVPYSSGCRPSYSPAYEHTTLQQPTFVLSALTTTRRWSVSPHSFAYSDPGLGCHASSSASCSLSSSTRNPGTLKSLTPRLPSLYHAGPKIAILFALPIFTPLMGASAVLAACSMCRLALPLNRGNADCRLGLQLVVVGKTGSAYAGERRATWEAAVKRRGTCTMVRMF